MNKYQNALLQNVRSQLSQWLGDEDEPVSHEAMHRFLHTIRGTAGTIGLQKLSEAAGLLMAELGSQSGLAFERSALQRFLQPLAAEALGEPDETQEGLPLGSSLAEEKLDDLPAAVVLLLDDDTEVLSSLKGLLEGRGCLVLAATEPEQAVRYLHRFQPDLLLYDPLIDERGGSGALLALRSIQQREFIPTTVLGRDDSRPSRIRAYRLGADDYVPKPPDAPELLAVLERQLLRRRRFKQLDTSDPLTGMERLSRTGLQPLTGGPAAAALIDFDGLDGINTRHGFECGDTALQAASAFLKEAVNLPFTPYRGEGDRLLLVFGGSSEAQAAEEMEGAAREFAAIEFQSDAGVFSVSWSVGVAGVISDPDPVSLLEGAEAALAAAKSRGGGCVCRLSARTAPAVPPLRVSVLARDAVYGPLLASLVRQSLPPATEADVTLYNDAGALMRADSGTETAAHLILVAEEADASAESGFGSAALAEIRLHPFSPRRFVLYASERGNLLTPEDALRLGADDYAIGSLGSQSLRRRLRRLAVLLTNESPGAAYRLFDRMEKV